MKEGHTMQEKDLKRFGAVIQQLINGNDISREQAYDSFSMILQNQQPDLHQGAFLAALSAKGETASEIAGVWESIVKFDTVKVTINTNSPLVENSGTGMDSLKTFNVSSAAGIVATACGATLARHGARALTSKRGTVDILESVGVDVECDADTVTRSIESIGIGIFNGMSPEVHPNGLGRILSQIRFGSTLNIAASLANPASPTIGLRGLHSEHMLNLVADVMQEIGYSRAILVHGKDDKHDGGMDEISITGKTIIKTFGMGNCSITDLRPEDVGMQTASYENIAALDNSDDATNQFISVLAGSGHKACVDFTCLNSAGILLASGITESLEAGITLSYEAVNNGTALQKLHDWVSVQSRDKQLGLDCFQQCLDNAGIIL